MTTELHVHRRSERDIHDIEALHMTQLDLNWWRGKAIEYGDLPTWEEELRIISVESQKRAVESQAYEAWFATQRPL